MLPPANDDAIRSVEIVHGVLGRSIIEGRLAGGYPVPKEALIEQATEDVAGDKTEGEKAEEEAKAEAGS